jgi:hypothetical protein
LDLREKNLRELAKILFSEKYRYLDEEKTFKGKSGKSWKFDALILDTGKFGVFIRDWKREISITQIRQLHKACKDVEDIEGGVMICSKSSEFSETYGKNNGIKVLDRGAIISKIRTQFF